MALRTMKPVHDATCAVACSADIIGSKWTALLVHDPSEGPRRFSELERACPGISPRTLSERLRALEHEGLVVRRSYAEVPPRVEYELSERGVALLPIIDAMRAFGHTCLGPEHKHGHAHVARSSPSPRKSSRTAAVPRSRYSVGRRSFGAWTLESIRLKPVMIVGRPRSTRAPSTGIVPPTRTSNGRTP